MAPTRKPYAAIVSASSSEEGTSSSGDELEAEQRPTTNPPIASSSSSSSEEDTSSSSGDELEEEQRPTTNPPILVTSPSPSPVGQEGNSSEGDDGEDDDEEDEEESGKSGKTAMSDEPKEMPLKRVEQPSSPSPEDAGAQGSDEASPARSVLHGGVKKPPPASQEEDEAEDSGDASPTRGLLPDDTAADGHNNERAATPKRGEKRSPPPQEGDERPEKRAVGPDHETVAASAPQRKKKSKRSAKKDRRKKKKKKQLSDTSPPQEKNRVQEDEHTGAQVNGKALQGSNALSTKLCGSETKKKPAVERSWSYDDELKILNALVVHAKSHNGALPDSSHLLANLTFDKIDANEEKLADKIHKLRTRYRKILVQGCPSDDLGRRLFKLSKILWGQVDEDERVEPTSRDFSVLSELYPHLSKEVKAYAEMHSSGDLIMAMFMTIGDEKARDLDAKCKKQQIEAFKLELGQASLINELLSALSSLTLVKF